MLTRRRLLSIDNESNKIQIIFKVSNATVTVTSNSLGTVSISEDSTLKVEDGENIQWKAVPKSKYYITTFDGAFKATNGKTTTISATKCPDYPILSRIAIAAGNMTSSFGTFINWTRNSTSNIQSWHLTASNKYYWNTVYVTGKIDVVDKDNNVLGVLTDKYTFKFDGWNETNAIYPREGYSSTTILFKASDYETILDITNVSPIILYIRFTFDSVSGATTSQIGNWNKGDVVWRNSLGTFTKKS